MTTDLARKHTTSPEAHRHAVAALPLQLLNYHSRLTPQQVQTLQAEARRQLGLTTSHPWRKEEAHAVMGHALREAARVLQLDHGGLELRQGPSAGNPHPATDQRAKPRTVQLNDARWAKLQALGPDWLARQIDAAPQP